MVVGIGLNVEQSQGQKPLIFLIFPSWMKDGYYSSRHLIPYEAKTLGKK